MNLIVSVEVNGKLFDLKAKPIVDAVQRSVQTLVENGEQRLDQLLKPRPGGKYLIPVPRGSIRPGPEYSQPGRGSTGYYRQGVADNTRIETLHGRISDGGVIYGPWLEGIGSRNATTRFKGYFSFRLTAQELQKQAPQVLQQNLDQAIRDLNQ